MNAATQEERHATAVHRSKNYEEYDATETMALFRELAQEGYAPAQCRLASYFDAVGKPQESREWLDKAFEQNCADAIQMMGYRYYLGKGGFPQDYAKAFEYYSRAAAMDQRDAILNLGQCYEDGEGCQQNYLKAAECYREITTPDDPDVDGCFLLAGLCLTGKLGSSEKINAEGMVMAMEARNMGHPGAKEMLKGTGM
jgi:TPR repeat protein